MFRFLKQKPNRYPVYRTTVGNWLVEVNQPAGIVVKNTEKKKEYHFAAKSNGWVSCLDKTDPKAEKVSVLEVNGIIRNAEAVLVDEESSRKYKRFYELRETAKSKHLTHHEQKELLGLLGIN